MKDILDKYALSTGLHINYSKSLLVPINLSTDSAVALAQSLYCSVGKLPFTYLGPPVGIDTSQTYL
jgi:hypothetical protein